MTTYRFHQYQIACRSCGASTSKKHARGHGGLCARCTNPEDLGFDSRSERIIEHGYQAYAIEEGHHDQNGDN